MDFILNVDRQFPDKAIDLIDEACANTRMQIDNQKYANASQKILAKKVKKAIVRPEHVAQVGMDPLFSLYMIFVLSMSCT